MPNQALQQTSLQWIFWDGSCLPCGGAAELVVRQLESPSIPEAVSI
jgi:hypothetical protein